MNKSQLIEVIASETKTTKAKTKEVIDAAFVRIKSEMVIGNDVSIADFGIFSTTERAARDGHNPQTGEKVKIAARTSPKFKPSKALKDALNQPKKGKSKK